MIKKLAVIALIFAGNLQAVILKNGTDARYYVIRGVACTLKKLYESGNLVLLAHLDRGAHAQGLIIPFERSGCTPEAFAADIIKLQNLGFCDQAGCIPVKIADVIKGSLSMVYKGAGRFAPIKARLRSPTAFRNYISPLYWFERALTEGPPVLGVIGGHGGNFDRAAVCLRP